MYACNNVKGSMYTLWTNPQLHVVAGPSSLSPLSLSQSLSAHPKVADYPS